MKTASIFLKKKLEENTDHFLDNSQIHYLKKVLKIKAGESIYVYDGQGSKNSALFNGEDTIQIVKKDNQKRKFEVTALVPFLKRAQFEFQIQKMVEIGVKSIICYVSAKTKDKYNLDKELDKTKRYEEIITSAFLQSENFYLPKISFIDSLSSFNMKNFKMIIVLDQNSKKTLGLNINCDLMISGGEFGYDQSEIDFLSQNQATFFNLGENILRAETAPLVALSRINF